MKTFCDNNVFAKFRKLYVAPVVLRFNFEAHNEPVYTTHSTIPLKICRRSVGIYQYFAQNWAFDLERLYFVVYSVSAVTIKLCTLYQILVNSNNHHSAAESQLCKDWQFEAVCYLEFDQQEILTILRPTGIHVARIFSGGAPFFTNNMMTFFSHHPLLHGHIPIYVIYCHQLPFYLICGGAPHQIQPHFASFQQKCLEKFFSSP